LENSLDNHPDIQLIFSENTKVLASCLSVYLVFPFLESELSNLLAEHISLPDYALVDFNNALKACFLDKPIDRKKTNNENELFMDCIESERTSNSFELTSDNKKDDNNLTLNVTESELPLNQIENQKVFFNQNDSAEDVGDNPSIIFECEKCNINLTQDTILEHQCHTKENKNHNYENEMIEADKIDEVEVILEYEEDGIEENICDDKIISNENSVRYVCDACGEIFETRTAMLDHLSLGSSYCTGKLKTVFNKHIKSTLEQRQQLFAEYDELLDCSYCNKSFRHRSHLIQHQRSHTKEKPFKCDVCPSTFSTNGNLKNHKEKHKDFSERKFKCVECDFAATSAVLLKYHMNSHKGVKMFECEHCGASYMRPHSLRKHRKKKCNSNRLSQITDHKEYEESSRQDVYILPDIISQRSPNEVPDYGVHSLELLVDNEDDLVDSEIVNDDLNLLIVQTQR